MAATATKKKEKDVTISDKLEMLLKLQQIDTEIDRIRTIRGELPIEVQELEDEVLGLTTRIAKINDENNEIEEIRSGARVLLCGNGQNDVFKHI